MKVWMDTTLLKPAHTPSLIEAFPQLIFETDIEKAQDAEIAICLPHFVTKEILDKLPQLKWIQLLSAGYDACDLDYVKQRGIDISYAKDTYSIQIAEDTVSKILYFNRNLGVYHDHLKTQTWETTPVKRELYGATVGIIGTGSIGDEIAKRLIGFETTLLGYRRTKKPSVLYHNMYHDQKGLHTVLSLSDYVIICLPLTEQTHHFISEKELSWMKDSAILINIARGKIIDQEALVYALNNDIIGGAALDVTDPEPLPKENPLWHAKNLFLTPHNAGSSPLMYQRLITQLKHAIKTYIEGKNLDNIIKL